MFDYNILIGLKSIILLNSSLLEIIYYMLLSLGMIKNLCEKFIKSYSSGIYDKSFIFSGKSF